MNLRERLVGMEHVLQHILGDEDVDRLIRKGERLDVLAAHTVMQLARWHVRKVLR